MHWIDWLIVGLPMLVVFGIGIQVQRYVRGVSDFLAAGRAAGRFLVCSASSMAGTGLISFVAFFEMYYKSGYAVGWWAAIGTPIFLLITLSGYLAYRYRETRVMTMAQFFEVRYSKRFRIFAGILAAASGIINYGIFPAVAGRFFLYYCGFPEHIRIFGWSIPTLAALMAIFLSAALSITLLGGQLTAMVTDAVQGLFNYLMVLVVVGYVLYYFGPYAIYESLSHTDPGKSLLNPFDTFKLEDFNLGFILINIFGGIYCMMAWQGNQGFNCSAVSPHEAKMGRILSSWRDGCQGLMIMLLAMAAYTLMHNASYASHAATINHILDTIANPKIREQMLVPVSVSHMLPAGLKGIFAAIMLFHMITTDTSYLHSWGAIVIQDCVLPFRKKPFTSRQHLWLLRIAIIAVAMFGFWFSLLFTQTDYIFMFFAVTGAIYLGGAGSVIVGGLYWKKGTTPAAWTAMLAGSILAVAGILLQQYWKSLVPLLIAGFPAWTSYLTAHAEKFPINGQWLWLLAMLTSITLYILVSLFTCKKEFNMDRMLHRGKYALEPEAGERNQDLKPPRTLESFLGIDNQFTRGDRILSYSVFSWTMYNFALFAAISAFNLLLYRWPIQWWINYNVYYGLPLSLLIGVVTTIWFTFGTLVDLKKLFHRLSAANRDACDDGRVLDLKPEGQEKHEPK